MTFLPLLEQQAPTASFFVPGIPVPKGSAKSFWNKKAHKIVTMQDNRDKQQPWSSLISMMAQAQGLRPSERPCKLSMDFVFPRPKGHLRSNGYELKPSAPKHHIGKPDLDKLKRCVQDALTGIAYRDDSQVFKHGESGKRYAKNGEQPGVHIIVSYED